MGRLQVGAACLILATSSYAWAQAPADMLGAAAPRIEEGAVSGGPSALAGAPTSRGRVAARIESVLGGLQPQARSNTRGAREVQVYQQASPAVVMVITDDGVGSGALISEDGKIVTNHHVVGDAKVVGVVFKPAAEGAEIDETHVRMAKVIRRDGVTDLALLQAQVPAGVKPLALGDLSKLQVGADVHAIGHPTGETWTYTRGIVSQVRKDYEWTFDDGSAHKATVIQTQTPINPGNSGGPLLSDDLTLLGVNSFSGDGEGLNYAISADDVRALLAMTEDRAAEAAPSHIPPGCEEKVVGEEAAKDPAGMYFLIDETCDGEGDYTIFEPKRKRDPIIYMFDDDRDGTVETLMIDEGRDGDFDVALYDTDNDGESDLRGEFRDGEDEPYRVERLAKE